MGNACHPVDTTNLDDITICPQLQTEYGTTDICPGRQRGVHRSPCNEGFSRDQHGQTAGSRCSSRLGDRYTSASGSFEWCPEDHILEERVFNGLDSSPNGAAGLSPEATMHLTNCWEEDWTPPSSDGVYVHLYDLSESISGFNKLSLNLGLGAMLHAGVEVFGHEWAFGTQGVAISLPRRHRFYHYRETVFMGKTPLARSEVEQALHEMRVEWRSDDYDIFRQNCNTFANALCVRLGVGPIPNWVNRLAEEGGKSKAVRGVAVLLARTGMLGECPESMRLAGWDWVTDTSNDDGAENAPVARESARGSSSPTPLPSGRLRPGWRSATVTPGRGNSRRLSPSPITGRRLPRHRCENFYDQDPVQHGGGGPPLSGEFPHPVTPRLPLGRPEIGRKSASGPQGNSMLPGSQPSMASPCRRAASGSGKQSLPAPPAAAPLPLPSPPPFLGAGFLPAPPPPPICGDRFGPKVISRPLSPGRRARAGGA